MPRRERDPRGHIYLPDYLNERDRAAIVEWLATLHPIWEYRYALNRAPPSGQPQRKLLRPVYWLGNWQFACLEYYRPPKGVHERCLAAEPFPPPLRRIARDMERRARASFPKEWLPHGFVFNTCLVNFYGSRLEDGRAIDCARVGEHRDFEPGPVGSLSLGERALFQFVSSKRVGERDAPILSQWLDDGSLQLFAGPLYKERVFHRVQRVDRKRKLEFPPAIDGFRTRRINLTFRFVPPEHIVPLEQLSPARREDILPYLKELALRSPFFARALERAELT
ncbi:MAG TPA: alpha-ketoglutarate-dependent dioxygenase AlkB [Polyangiaceae bacterium]|nr:alpha-ketoglutarate-dependent dioxygenase AlkB [Polyangiaceae bacterium]